MHTNITPEELRESLAVQLSGYSTRLDGKEIMQIALAVGKSNFTVKRYLKGTVKEVRNTSVANKIVEAASALLNNRKAEFEKI